MDSQTPVIRVLQVVLASLFAFAAPAHSQQFGYSCENCPTNWGNLDAEFSACSEGTMQSPIAFSPRDANPKSLRRLHIDFEETSLEVEALATNFEAFDRPGCNARLHGSGCVRGARERSASRTRSAKEPR